MKLTIPLNLSRRLCDISWMRSIPDKDHSSITHNQALALLMRVWMFFGENRSGRIQDHPNNRDILAGCLCIADESRTDAYYIEKMISAGVIQAQDGILILTDFEDLQKDIATKGAHGRAAAISVKAAKTNALKLLDYQYAQGVSSVHDVDVRKRAYAILIAINTALGRKPMAAGEYTDALVADVVAHIPAAITDDDVKNVCSWIRRYVSMDRRLKQSLPIVITMHWHSIYEAALKDEGPLS